MSLLLVLFTWVCGAAAMRLYLWENGWIRTRREREHALFPDHYGERVEEEKR